MKSHKRALVVGTLIVVAAGQTLADDAGDGAAEMARKLQNPLANIRALVTDNAIGFDTGVDGGTSYGFQLQPVYAIDFASKGFTFLPRAVIPIMGLEPGTNVPPVGQPIPPDSGSVWGLGDSVIQGYFAPHSSANWKWGIGPQLALKTRTDSRLGGPGWGGGVAGVLVGSLSPELSLAVILGNIWSFDGDFSTALVQPMLFYNFPSHPGLNIGYNAPITADWKASSGNRWTVPLGFTFGKTFDMGNGNGLDLGIGPYYMVARPDGSSKWQVRFGVSWLFP